MARSSNKAYIDRHLSPSDEYEYQIWARNTFTGTETVNELCEDPASGVDIPCTGTTDDPYPGSPVPPTTWSIDGLAVLVQDENVVKLSWADVNWLNGSDEDEFVIERSVNGNIVVFEEVGAVPADSLFFFDTSANGLNSATLYVWRVFARNGSGGTEHTNEVSDLTGNGPPTQPSNPVAVPLVGTSGAYVNLSWTDNSANETHFRIEKKIDDGADNFSFVGNAGADQTTYQDIDVLPVTTYIYRLRAENSFGESIWIGTTVSTEQVPPDRPENLRVISMSPSAIHLAWDDQSINEEHFIVERRVDAGSFEDIDVLEANTESFIDGTVTENTTYRYRVRAVNVAGSSLPSNVVVVYTDFADNDNDGYTSDVDCNDNDPNINPGMADNWNNGADFNCKPDRVVCYTDYLQYGFGGYSNRGKLTLDEDTYEPYDAICFGWNFNGNCLTYAYDLYGDYESPGFSSNHGIKVEKLSAVRFKLTARITNITGQLVEKSCEAGD